MESAPKEDVNVRLITAGISGKKAILPMVIVGLFQAAYVLHISFQYVGLHIYLAHCTYRHLYTIHRS